MKKLWTSPNTIEVVEVLNNRELNSDYIGSLAESMEANGFIAEYPIEVYEAKNIPSVETERLYVCACGAHRTRAAIQANIDQVFVEIYDGGEEDWIERMSLDNFKFDVSEDPSIGQTFTQKEKRKACTQLLMLPKYLKQTNTWLAEQWNTSEGTIRGWRKTVASYIYEGSDKLEMFGVSVERIERLKKVLESTEREDADGNMVEVRKPVDPKVSEQQKKELWDKLQDDADHWKNKDTFCVRNEISWNTIRDVAGAEFGIEGRYHMYTDMSLPQIRKLHNRILTDDAELIAKCREYDAVQKEREENESKLNTAVRACRDALSQLVFGKVINTYSDGFDKLKSEFTQRTQQHGYPEFSFDTDDFDTGDGFKVDVIDELIAMFEAVTAAIENEEDWVIEIRNEFDAALGEKLEELHEEWTEARQEVLDAFKAYPRNISIEAFCYAADDESWNDAGTMMKLLNKEQPNKNAGESTIKSQVEDFHNAAGALLEDEDWVKAIPEAKLLMEVITGEAPKVDAEGPAPVEPPFTFTADDLHALPLNDIFKHLKDRVIYIPVNDESGVMADLAQILGKASRGQVGTQLHLLMQFALLISPKSDIEGQEVEKAEQ